MCIGIPMQVVVAVNRGTARCRTRDGDAEHLVDTRLVGTLEPGAWLIVSRGAAREVIAEETAHKCTNALQALDMAMRGEMDFDHLFADLVNREPELPAFLRTSERALCTAEEVLTRAKVLLRDYTEDGPHNVIDLVELDATERAQLSEILGEGEVTVSGNGCYASEAIFPGLWYMRVVDVDVGERVLIEVGRFPTSIATLIFRNSQTKAEIPASFAPNIMNAPLLLAEINEHLAHVGSGQPHLINLSRLPHTDADLETLTAQLGPSNVVIQSRSFGVCTASATSTRNVWRVGFHDARGALILDTIEITPIPEVVCATKEDIALSAERLAEFVRTRS